MPDARTRYRKRTPHSDKFVPPGEGVIVAFKPHPLFIVLRSIVVTLGVALFTWGAIVTLEAIGTVLSTRPILVAASVLITLRIGWDALEWLARLYVMTDRRVIRVAGVLQQHTADIPLERVQHVTLFRLIRERIFGLGTISFTTAGTGVPEASWVMIDRPHQVLATVRNALATPSPSGRTLVIGVAGGIGSGKSELARAFGELGCVVVDSDKEAKEALDRPEVRDTLREWWGDRVIGGDGRVDRRVVAEIIFGDPKERARLESLVHPIVRRSRAEYVGRARAAGAPAVIVDAPLLFEAGVNKECDAVVFVDTPRELRVERVRRTRGWDEEELERRESAQWPLERKREASTIVLRNEGGRAALVREARRALDRLREEIVAESAEGR